MTDGGVAPVAAIGVARLSAGVGDTHLEGAAETSARRYIVASGNRGRGEGQHALNAEVGVGEVSVRLQ